MVMDASESSTDDNGDAHKDKCKKKCDEPRSLLLLLWCRFRDTEGVDKHTREKE